MLTLPPAKLPGKRQPVRPAPGTPALTLVTGVTLEDAGTVIWHFSSTYSGDSACLALTVNDGGGGGGGWVSPDAVDAPDDTSIRAFYSGVTLNGSSTWRLLTQIDGVTFTDGPLIVPQSGTVLP